MNGSRFAEQARQLLQESLDQLNALKNANVRDTGFKQWRQNALTLIQRLCPGGVAAKGAAPQLASACANASATGLQQAILVTCFSFVLGAAFYLLAARTLRRDLGGAVAAEAAA